MCDSPVVLLMALLFQLHLKLMAGTWKGIHKVGIAKSFPKEDFLPHSAVINGNGSFQIVGDTL